MTNPLRVIAGYLEDHPAYAEGYPRYVSNVNFKFNDGGSQKGAAALVDRVVHTKLSIENSAFADLPFDPWPDGFTQFVYRKDGKFVLQQDNASASDWLPQYLFKIEAAGGTRSTIFRDDLGLQTLPTVLIRPITNRSDASCAYFVAPMELVIREVDELAERLEMTNTLPLGSIGDPQTFVRRLLDGEGRFILPEALASFNGLQLEAFWMLSSIFFDGGLGLDKALVPFELVRRAAQEAAAVKEQEQAQSIFERERDDRIAKLAMEDREHSQSHQLFMDANYLKTLKVANATDEVYRTSAVVAALAGVVALSGLIIAAAK